MTRTKYLSLIIAGFLTIVATGCIVSVEPERATNPVGTEHTVTLTLQEVSNEVLCEIFQDIENDLVDILEGEEIPPIAVPIVCQHSAAPAVEPELQIVVFEIVGGPNAGQNSVFHGVCEPSCGTFNESTSWTYRSNGAPGTDVISACVNYPALLNDTIDQEVVSTQLSVEELLGRIEEAILDAVNDALGSDYETVDDFFCQSVTNTWVDRDRPNIGAGLSGLFQGQPTPLPTAAAPAAPSPVIRPPSTGDAGLK